MRVCPAPSIVKWSRRASIENGSAGLVSSTSRLRSITFARPDGVAVEVTLQRTLTRPQRRAIADAADRYGRFLETPVSAGRER